MSTGSHTLSMVVSRAHEFGPGGNFDVTPHGHAAGMYSTHATAVLDRPPRSALSCVAREAGRRYSVGASAQTIEDLRAIESELGEAERLRASAAGRLASVRARGDGEMAVGMSLAQHLRNVTRLRRDHINSISVLGDVLGDLPTLAAALASGAVSVDQAAAIAKHAARFGPTIRRALDLELSSQSNWQSWTPEHLASEMGRLLATMIPRVAVEQERTAPQREYLDIHASADGQGIDFKGHYEGLQAAQFLASIDASSPAPRRGVRRGEQRAAGLARVLSYWATGGRLLSADESSAAAAVIHLLIDEHTATEGAAAELWTSLPGFAPTLTADAVARLAPTATTITSIARNGVPVAIKGRKGHAIDDPDGLSEDSLDELVRVRDGCRCRMPGCDRPIEDVHHLVYRANGGRDRMANLAGLCKRCHHRVLHDRGWNGKVDTDGRLHLQRHGRTLTSPARKHLRLGQPPPLADPEAAANEAPLHLDQTGQPLPF